MKMLSKQLPWQSLVMQILASVNVVIHAAHRPFRNVIAANHRPRHDCVSREQGHILQLKVK